MPEYNLVAVLDVGGTAGLEISEINYDRAYRADLRVGVDGDLQVIGEEYDRMTKGTIDSGSIANLEIELLFNRSHKSTIEVSSEDLLANPSVVRWMSADLVVGSTGAIAANPARDIKLSAPIQDVGEKADFLVNPGVDRYFKGNIVAGESADFFVQNIMRRLLGLPPRGSLSLISDSGAKELNGCAIAPGSTKILELEVYGTRLDCYRVHFMVALEPSHFATQENLLVNRVYDPKQPGIGGITVKVPIHPETTDLGREEQAIYQIVLLPSDINIGNQSRTVFYSVRLSDGPPSQTPPVYGELYRLEEGRFTIALDGNW